MSMKRACKLTALKLHHTLVAALLISVCLLPGAAAALLDTPGFGDFTYGDQLPTATSAGLALTRAAAGSGQGRPDPHAPRADLTLTPGGRLLLSRRVHDLQNSLWGLPLSEDDLAPVLLAPSPASGGHASARGPLTAELSVAIKSRRLPPEFLAFPVYRNNALSSAIAAATGERDNKNDDGSDVGINISRDSNKKGDSTGEVDGGGGRSVGSGEGDRWRHAAVESPLVEQLVTSTSAPRGKTPPPPPPTTTTPTTTTAATIKESVLETPEADCDSGARLAPPHCRALQQLRRRTLQHRQRQAARRELQRIIELHLAEVAAASLTARTQQDPKARSRQPVTDAPTQQPVTADLTGRAQQPETADFTRRQPVTEAPTQHAVAADPTTRVQQLVTVNPTAPRLLTARAQQPVTGDLTARAAQPVTVDLTARTQQPVIADLNALAQQLLTDLRKQQSTPGPETPIDTVGIQPNTETYSLGDILLLRARSVPQPTQAPSPHTTAKASPHTNRRRHKAQSSFAQIVLTPRPQEWTSARVESTEVTQNGTGTELVRSSSNEQGTSVTDRPHEEAQSSYRETKKLHWLTNNQHRETDKFRAQVEKLRIETDKSQPETNTQHRETDRPRHESDHTHGEIDTPHRETDTQHRETDRTRHESGKAHIETDRTRHESGKAHIETDRPRHESGTSHPEIDPPHREIDGPIQESDHTHGEIDTPHRETDTLNRETHRRHHETGKAEEALSDEEIVRLRQEIARLQSKWPSLWTTYDSSSPNSIKTAPKKHHRHVAGAINPVPTIPGTLFTTTIVPAGGMPITQKGVIPGLLDIPARVQFSCRNRPVGFYGNSQTGCQVYHQCTADGKKYDYLCGVGTAFNAKTNTCDHWYNTECERS